MGGAGSGRKSEGLHLRREKAIAIPERPELTSEQLEVSRLSATLTETFADALETCESPEALATFGAGQRKGKAWKSRVYRRAALVALTAGGMRQADIAELLGVSVKVVRATLYQMRKSGILVDCEDRLDKGIVPAAIEALENDVLNPASPGHQKAYLAVLGGRGHLRTHTVGKETGAAPAVAVLNVKFEMPSDGTKPVLNGQVVGVPRE